MDARLIESRLIELETKISYQDHVIGELNDVVIRQQTQIDQLEKSMLRVHEQLKQSTGSDIARPDEEVPPPHY
ncbi:MAG: SlyX family protein [Mariprofundus sp.]|nr:SlyX family protein [Mariprofundus sp.]